MHTSTYSDFTFQNPIYHYPYYSLVYNVGFYLTEYKLVSPSPQSSSKLHHTRSHPIIVSSYSFRIIIKVLTLVILHRLSSFLVKTLSFFVISCRSLSFLVTAMYLRSVGVDLEGQVTLPSTLIPLLFVLVFIGDSVICALAGVSTC